MTKLLVFKPSSSIFVGCFLASLFLSSFLKAASSNVSSVALWVSNDEIVTGEPTKDEVRVDIVFSQWIVGQTKECGCSMSIQGGLKARERELEKLRSSLSNPLLLDLGNTFFPDSTQKKEKLDPLSELKNAQEIAKAYHKWKFDAVVLSSTELEQANFEKTKSLLAVSPGFKVLSLDQRAKSFSQPYFDKVIANTGIRFIPVVNALLEGSAFPDIGSLLHNEYLNIFVGDVTYKNLKKFELKLPAGSRWVYMGANPDYPNVEAYKTDKLLHFIGATRKQNWMVASLYLNPSHKNFRYKTESVVTYFSLPKINNRVNKSTKK